ncbi:MAG: FkbM family methyltransferase [Solirubrobacteraceae bacterium]
MRRALRRLGASPRLEPATALLLRARCVRESARFIARELLRSRVVSRYHARRSGLPLLIRHRSADVVTLGEIFHRPDYEPPPQIAARLEDRPLRILDLGANVGLFGVFAAGRWPQASVTAVEPDPDNLDVLRRCVELSDRGDAWQVVAAAAAAHDGTVSFQGGGQSLSRIAPGVAHSVPAIDALARLSGVDLLKMDIEGGEWAILDDPRFIDAAPAVTVLEYHPHLCPHRDPRAAVEAVFTRAGQRTHTIFARADGHGMLWAWRS